MPKAEAGLTTWRMVAVRCQVGDCGREQAVRLDTLELWHRAARNQLDALGWRFLRPPRKRWPRWACPDCAAGLESA